MLSNEYMLLSKATYRGIAVSPWMVPQRKMKTLEIKQYYMIENWVPQGNLKWRVKRMRKRRDCCFVVENWEWKVEEGGEWKYDYGMNATTVPKLRNFQDVFIARGFRLPKKPKKKKARGFIYLYLIGLIAYLKKKRKNCTLFSKIIGHVHFNS